jgi:hypothetical protein
MTDARAMLVAALAILGLVVLMAYGANQRQEHGRLRTAAGARAIQQLMAVPPTLERRGRGLRRVIVSGEVTPTR